jgi:photosystem II stability/assembly factor-like uncharacterized protein
MFFINKDPSLQYDERDFSCHACEIIESSKTEDIVSQEVTVLITAKNGLLKVALSVGLSLLFLAMSLPASAGINQWTSNGPSGGYILALAIDPSNTAIIYAVSYDVGAYKSTDGGGSWSPLSFDLLGDRVNTLAIDPENPTTLYAGISGGVFKSTDGGGSWVDTGINHDINALAIDPVNPSIIYAGTQYDGVYRSTNGGEDWREINSGLTADEVRVLAIDPANPATIYAGTGDGGVFKSFNSGDNWVNVGLTSSTVWDLAIDPANPATIYAVTSKVGSVRSTL